MLPIPVLIKGIELFVSGAFAGKQVYNAVTKNPQSSKNNISKTPVKG